MPKVEIHPEAQAEVDATIAWYEQEGAGLGLEFLAEVDRAIDRVVQRPVAWRSYAGMPDAHRLSVHRFPYCVIYRQKLSVVQIVAVAHQRRKPSYWRERLANSNRHSR